MTSSESKFVFSMVVCELCGKGVIEAYRVEVLGSTVNACASCASSGKVVGRVERAGKKKAAPAAVPKKPAEFSDEDWSLVENYGGVVKKAREGMNLKQEDLAKKINEPESLIHRIESGHDRPNPDVAKKLEKTLRVRLMAAQDSVGVDVKGGGKGEVTLGDVVVVRKKKK